MFDVETFLEEIDAEEAERNEEVHVWADRLRTFGVHVADTKFWTNQTPFAPVEAFGFTLPQAMLSFDPETLEKVVSVELDFEWYAVRHETAGFGAKAKYRIATFLDVREDVFSHLEVLNEIYSGTSVGARKLKLSEASQYAGWLKLNMGLECEVSYDLLEEAYYPVDISEQNLRLLTDVDVPTDLNEMFWFENELDRDADISERWELAFLTKNT